MSHIQSRPKIRATKTSEDSSRNTSTQSLPKIRGSVSDQKYSNSVEVLTDRATLFLIRRTLCSQHGDKVRSSSASIDEILPCLTSSNDVDVQLYAFIAIIVREYVLTWYHTITSDHIFIEELLKIIAHCSRALEQRLRKVDFESLLLDEIPEVLETHIRAFQASHIALHPIPLEHDPRLIYHSIWPLPLLAPIPRDHEVSSSQQQEENESAYRQLLVEGILALFLPTEDLENSCLTSLVTDILSELILGGTIEQASEPWLIWEAILNLTEAIKPQISDSCPQVQMEQPMSSTSHSKTHDCTNERGVLFQFKMSLQRTLWLFLQFLYLIFTTIHYTISTYASLSTLPCRNGASIRTQDVLYEKDGKSISSRHQSLKKPILTMKFWSCGARLLDLDMRMPWLKASFSMFQWFALTGPGKVGDTDQIIDKVLSHALKTQILAPAAFPNLLKSARAALFPNNTLAPPRQVPDAAECKKIRRRCAESILQLIPKGMREIYLGSEWEDMVAELENGLLYYFSDKYCNKHLLYGLVELVILRIMPELTERGIAELIEERLS